MSEMTRCNRCTLDDIEREAKRQGRKVLLEPDPTPEFPNAVRVIYIERGADSHLKLAGSWFAELTPECAC